jgi:broad specificity phosphatase PhoE
MYLFLVRHGQSLWNAEERHQGWNDVALSALGELQAERIGQRLKDQPFDYCFTSPIYRCYQTASAIVRAQGHAPATTLRVLEGLKEARISARMEGMLSKDMIKGWTKEEKERFRDDYTFKFEDGESVQEVMARTLAVFTEIAMLSEEWPQPPAGDIDVAEEVGASSRDVVRANSPETDTQAQTQAKPAEKPKIVPKTALVVTHKINAQLMVLHALNATDAIVKRQTNIDRLEIGNCALSVIEVNLKGKEPFFRLLSTNDANHLAGLKAPTENKENK